jgi:hypothetical protein
VAFNDKNHLIAAGFYFTNLRDIVRCAFCGVKLVYWQHEDDPFMTTIALVRLVGSFDVYLSGTFLLVLPTSLAHYLSTLPEVAHFEYKPNSYPERLEVLLFVFLLFLSVQLLEPPSLIFNFLLAASSRI